MDSFDKKIQILIIGIQSSLAKNVVAKLLKRPEAFYIFGIDSRNITDLQKTDYCQFEKIRYSQTQIERIFRENKFDYILHLGRMGSTKMKINMRSKLNVNINTTHIVLEMAEKYNIKNIRILSTFHVYGALPENAIYLNEDSPLKASFNFSELRDVVEMDQICTNWMWKNQQKTNTIIFRPTHITGPQTKNSISNYLRTPLAPYPMDYNPLLQFIHEEDMAEIIAESIYSDLTLGVYNVAPDELISLHQLIDKIHIRKTPFSFFILSKAGKFFRHFLGFPHYLIDYLKYSLIIDNSRFKKAFPNISFKNSSIEKILKDFKAQ